MTPRSSIERIGPQRYEYQYLATVYYGLLCVDAQRHLWVEHVDGEDATSELREGSELDKRIVDIQVKGVQGDADAERVSAWLAHFPAGRSLSWVEQLLAERNRWGVIITTARSRDDVRSLLGRLEDAINASRRSGVTEREASLILQAIEKVYPTGKGVEEYRHQHFKNFSSRVTLRDFRDVLERVIVIEKCDNTSLRKQVGECLTRQHRIPQGDAESVMSLLCEEVRTARDLRSDLLPLLHRCLRKYQVVPARIGCEHSPGLVPQ